MKDENLWKFFENMTPEQRKEYIEKDLPFRTFHGVNTSGTLNWNFSETTHEHKADHTLVGFFLCKCGTKINIDGYENDQGKWVKIIHNQHSKEIHDRGQTVKALRATIRDWLKNVHNAEIFGKDTYVYMKDM